MERLWRADISAATRFLTRIPLPPSRRSPAGPEDLGRAVRAFSLIGALIGLAGGLVYAIAGGLGLPDLVSAILAVGATVLLTGALHEDGLADMADGFGGGATAESKLAIMRDSRIGAYGVIALVVVLAAKVGAIADLERIGLVVTAMLCAAAASRAVMPAIMLWVAPARHDGLAADAGRPIPTHVWTGILFAVAITVILLTWSGIVALIFCALGGAGIVWLARRHVGGHTGDVLGAAQQVAELLFLLALAAVR